MPRTGLVLASVLPAPIAAAAARAADGIEPLNDIHASADFRAHLAQVNTRRALEKALARG
jgi:carbon-monoxide dehydrogenase medium subunit